MVQPRSTKPTPGDADGVRVVTTGGVRGRVWLGAGLLLGLVLLAIYLKPRPAADRPQEEPLHLTSSPPTVTAGKREGRSLPFKPVRKAVSVPSDVVDANLPAEMAEARADAAGQARTVDEESGTEEAESNEPSGIALFPPPGTNPPKPGLIVPEDFELPPGFVRHYQATDDGKQLPAILMFHPDFDWIDKEGQPLQLPEDGIVPPELAPAGMPIETLQIPDTHIEVIAEPEDAPSP